MLLLIVSMCLGVVPARAGEGEGEALRALERAAVSADVGIPAPPAISERVEVGRVPTKSGRDSRQRPLRLLMMGPPGSGKGTQAKRLGAEFGMPPISAGEMLVEYARTHPEVDEYIRRGALVPIEVVAPIVRERLSKPDARERGFILDGFPRGVDQAEALLRILQDLGVALDAAIVLGAREGELLRRVLARGRPDDTEAVFRNRMRVYREQTEPVFVYLRGRVPLLPVNAEADPDTVYREIRRVLGK